jgi:hypothetical protein
MCIVNYKIFKVLLIKHFKSKIKFISNKGLFLRSGKWQYFRIPPLAPFLLSFVGDFMARGRLQKPEKPVVLLRKIKSLFT